MNTTFGSDLTLNTAQYLVKSSLRVPNSGGAWEYGPLDPTPLSLTKQTVALALPRYASALLASTKTASLLHDCPWGGIPSNNILSAGVIYHTIASASCGRRFLLPCSSFFGSTKLVAGRDQSLKQTALHKLLQERDRGIKGVLEMASHVTSVENRIMRDEQCRLQGLGAVNSRCFRP